MKHQLKTKYDHHQVEEGRYNQWLKKGYFTAGDKHKEPFTIVIPPPNVTGILHIGHAFDTTIQDMIARYKRMQGYDVLYLPGMDHAGIATQAKVEARLKKQGLNRYDLGREKFLERAWAWKEEYAATIRSQWAKLGLSLDYTRERFTMDEGLNEAVRKVFVQLYHEGLIYRGKRIINWDPQAKTALSNIEVVYQDDPGKMFYFSYDVKDSQDSFTVATTRPETMFGDVCVVVNPKDKRYQHLIGQYCINPANGDVIPVIGDEYVDIEFGTGAMKCTPAHDPNDFEIGKRHQLEAVLVMNPDGTMNEKAGCYQGMDRYACREQLVKEIEKNGHLVKIEEFVHSVGHSERTNAVVEPYLSEQWFVKMKPLAQDVLKTQADETEKMTFYPPRFEKTFNNWLENIEDWCISRQLWWGHRIPAWYHKDTKEIYVGQEAPQDIENWKQDEDVLDTWFSSALWPFSTLGWPKETEDFKRYYPNSMMGTGYDIIFFWVARMAFQARHFTGQAPFKDVVLHGLIRDAKGRKMSKSLGNGIDPMEVIDQYGVDALRYFLTTNSTPGQDLRYIPEKVEAAWNFINKIWNASRFVLMNLEDTTDFHLENKSLNSIDKWILTKLNKTIEQVTLNMDKYEFGLAGSELYGFVWDDFCSWYLELAKSNLRSEHHDIQAATKATLAYVLKAVVRLLHPYMPFVTEEIYLNLPEHLESIQQESWPIPMAVPDFNMESMERIVSTISRLREVKSIHDLKPNVVLHFCLKDLDGNKVEKQADFASMIQTMTKCEWVEEIYGEPSIETLREGSLMLAMKELSDPKEEKVKLEKEKIRLEGEIKRSKGMLSNPNFIQKAPKEKVELEQQKQETYRKQYEVVLARLKELKDIEE